jgi:hypothetical protein
VLALIALLTWPLWEALRFHGSSFLEARLPAGYLLICFAVALLIAWGAFTWSKEQPKTVQPPLIWGFQQLEEPEHIRLLERLFDGRGELKLEKEFAGGYRNTGVFQVSCRGYPDCVVKFAPSRDVLRELDKDRLYKFHFSNYGANYRAHEVGAKDDDPGAIWYSLAGLVNPEKLENFIEFYRRTEDDTAVAEVVSQLCGMLPCNNGSDPARLPLYGEYDRLARKLDGITAAVTRLPEEGIPIAGCHSPQVRITLPGVGDKELRNPLHWVKQTFVKDYRSRTLTAFEGVVHGDLHSGNILIEVLERGAHLVWLIDFADAHKGHVLNDLCRLEADIKFILTKVTDEADKRSRESFFEQAYSFETCLTKPMTLAEFHPEECEFGELGVGFGKARACIEIIRRFAVTSKNALLGADLYPYYLSLLHATLPILAYQEGLCSPWQKLYAFTSAALLCETMDKLQAGG